MKYLGIYHWPCQDGLGAAWAFSKYMVENSYDFELCKGTYGSAHEEVFTKLKKNMIVYFLDFTFKRDKLIELASKVKKVIVIDHHISAYETLTNLPENVEFNFVNEHSGAYLTWAHFYKDVEVPLFLRYIEDYDIWANKLNGTHEFFAWFTARSPQTIQEFNNLIADFPETIDDFLESKPYRHGQTVMQYRQTLINYMLETPIFDELCGVKFVKFNSPYVQLNTYLGNQACAKFNMPAWTWYESVRDGKTVIINSLRSNGVGVDVSLIARQMGGGGHKEAAGFTGTK